MATRKKETPPKWAVAALLAFCIGVVYAPALNAPFIHDDYAGIVRNKSISAVWPLVGTKENPGPLNTPPDNPVSARPLVNLSLAINQRLVGLNSMGFHVVNVVIHFCVAMLLWAITRRTLRLPHFAGRLDVSSGWLALSVALLWSLHPLQSETVIYAIQRTELMMALFYLATLYCSLRYWLAESPPLEEVQGSGSHIYWLVLAVSACLCGMASKEVMVSAPLIVLLFERTFVSGSLAKALQRSWPLYVGLAATWILVIGLTFVSPRSNSAHFGLGPPVYIWWATQCKVFLMYLKLVVWPWPLLIHYQLPYVTALADAWKYVGPVLALGVVTLWLLWRNHAAGFLGTCVFAILVPTSIIPIFTEMAAERRMYLPLAALLSLFVLSGYVVGEAVIRRRSEGHHAAFVSQSLVTRLLIPVTVVALVFGLITSRRLSAYYDPMRLWQQVVELQPQNHLAHQNMGFYLSAAGNDAAAAEHYQEAVRLSPESTQARYALAMFLLKAGATEKAADELRQVVKARPGNATIRQNLAMVLHQAGRHDEAIVEYGATLELDPTNPRLHRYLGMALQSAKKYSEAITSYETALRLNPKSLDIYKHLADIYALANEREKSVAALKQGLELARAAGDGKNAQEFSAQLNSSR